MSAGFPLLDPNSPQQQSPSSGLRQPQDGAAEAQGPPQGQGLQQQASPVMRLLSGWMRVSQEIGQHHPPIAAMMQKIGQEVQAALMILAREVTGQEGLPTEQGAQHSTAPQINQSSY